MTREDEKLAADLQGMKKKLVETSIKLRDKAPWFSFLLWKYSETTEQAVKRLTPVKRDWEGGGGQWFAVCEDCRGTVGEHDAYCRHCGRPLED